MTQEPRVPLPFAVLAALSDAGGSLDGPPEIPGASRDDVLDAVAVLLRDGFVTATQNRGDNRLLAVRNLRLTAAGRMALATAVAARPAAGARAPAGGLEERRRRRALFMNALYDETNASTLGSAMPHDVGGRAGLTAEEAESVVEYLANEGLLKTETFDGDVAITHAGIKEVEQWLATPDGATDHFPPAANIHIAGNVYGLQTGTVGSTQNVTLAVTDMQAIEQFAAAVREDLDILPDEDRDAVLADLDTIAAQLRSPRPRAGVLREALHSVRAVVEGAAASGAFAAAAELAQHLPHL